MCIGTHRSNRRCPTEVGEDDKVVWVHRRRAARGGDGYHVPLRQSGPAHYRQTVRARTVNVYRCTTSKEPDGVPVHYEQISK
jgi:hypothetical protein